MAKRGPKTLATTSTGARQVRCAVYTRKSTDEGLDQAFNSLDAQREACAAYIASQVHEGWQLDPTLYDDGGYSGGTMERPALKRLLADVESGRIQVIVIYKVDRLTRALSDFARIVEVLDRHGASFVSVTQAFNTTTSMGRLTLNVLLSFAQFEREVTGERIRDKIAASKKKGMWMGGPIPMGYDLGDRKLLINEEEAETIRYIFNRHVELGSVRELADDLEAKGIRSKVRTMQDGRVTGGAPYGVGALAYLLRNVLYIGQIRHGDQIYDGEHEAIISPDLWEANQMLFSKAVNLARTRKSLPSPLSGHLEDALGRPMGPAHANRGNRRYRYYASRASSQHSEAAWRIPAIDVEAIIQRELTAFLGNPLRISAELADSMQANEGLGDACTGLATCANDAAALGSLLDRLGARIILRQENISIEIEADKLLGLLFCNGSVETGKIITLTIPVQMRRRGHELKLIYAAPEARPAVRDDRLINLLGQARIAYRDLRNGKATGASRRQAVRLARLSFLAPDIVMAILDGRQPIELTARSLLRVGDLPIEWNEQRRLLGFS
ncbi:MAG: recombinase family protein [Rhizorhabdus sp.]|uniref:recombinase family protein n=1 Tax=Rhizorhabdus sp. TaxID=1968843 RepID=UPI001B696F4B|nr:recombinase family protein [Rhizorhabdus sp.]MBP8232667.1 recombinase family protein [Rhizorhabdus sp.]